jgi:hypothetical protein
MRKERLAGTAKGPFASPVGEGLDRQRKSGEVHNGSSNRC